MERIGIAASRIARGNLARYNFFVIIISFLFSLLIFIISGLSIAVGLMILAWITLGASLGLFSQNTLFLVSTCLSGLVTIVVLFNLFAIGRNIKFKK